MMSKPRGDRQVPPGVREISRDSLNDLVTLLASEGLPIEDVAEPERRFFAFLTQTAQRSATVVWKMRPSTSLRLWLRPSKSSSNLCARSSSPRI